MRVDFSVLQRIAEFLVGVLLEHLEPRCTRVFTPQFDLGLGLRRSGVKSWVSWQPEKLSVSVVGENLFHARPTADYF